MSLFRGCAATFGAAKSSHFIPEERAPSPRSSIQISSAIFMPFYGWADSSLKQPRLTSSIQTMKAERLTLAGRANTLAPCQMIGTNRENGKVRWNQVSVGGKYP